MNNIEKSKEELLQECKKDNASLKEKSSPDFIRRLIAGVLTLNLCIYTLVGLFLWRSWHQYEATIAISTQSLAQVMENNIAGIIRKSDMALLSVADEAERQLASGGIIGKVMDEIIVRQEARVQELNNLWVSNDRGDLIQGTGNEQYPLVNIADREYFRQIRNNNDRKMFLSSPVLDRVTQKWVIIIARRINYPDGSFAGIVRGAFSIEFLTRLFACIDVGANGTIALRDIDLAVVARYPEPQGIASSIGQKSKMKEFIDEVRSGKNTATFTGRASVDNVTRTYTFRKFSGLPLYILVGRATDDYIAIWRKETLPIVALTLIFSLMTVIFSRSLALKWNNEKQAKEELRILNQELENRIAERTAALSQSNEQLQVELTERRQAEEALLESEKKYRRIVETATEGILSFDSNIRITFVNRQMTSMLGYTIEEMLGQKFESFLDEDQLNDHYRQMQNRSQGEDAFYELCVRRKDGRNHWLLVSAKALMDSKGKFTGSFAMFTDINERKLVEIERERLITELQSAIEQIKTLKGIVPICANCKKIRDDKGFWEQVEGYVSRHTEAEFSHGICPDCANKLYPELYKDNKGLENT
jgi:PAS domain S-box-containing protein